MSKKKKILIINRRAPYGRSNARESLDVALTCGVFELPVSLLFVDDGIFQLTGIHQAEDIGQKNLSANLAALPLYDIDQLYVCQRSLETQGLAQQDLHHNPQQVDQQAIQALIRDHDMVLTF
ncbi:MAG: sulfurtransferase complex subunit TusC [Pontibacterium sp.]